MLESILPKPIRGLKTYFIRYGWEGPIKIGRAKRIATRLQALQSAIPEDLWCIGWIDGDRENELHQKFYRLRMRGEWFYPDRPLLDFIKENTKPYGDGD